VTKKFRLKCDRCTRNPVDKSAFASCG
jgi:hypothetical protein